MTQTLDAPPAHASAIAPRSREQVATRLLASSADHSFDPLTAIDWEQPLDPTMFYMPEHRVSLYGTSLWDTLTREQQVELSKHEVASLMHIGIWFEVILMSLLARHAYDSDVRSKHVQYAWTELADECRHSVMFAMALDKMRTPNYAPRRKLHNLARTMHHAPMGPSSWASILVGEEFIDTAQREAMHRDDIQPLIREVTRIHVIEEARHVRYAREELARQVEGISKRRLAVERARIALSAFHIGTNFIHPNVYAAIGLDAAEANRVATANPNRQDNMKWMAAKLVDFLRSLDLIGGPTERLWAKAHLL